MTQVAQGHPRPLRVKDGNACRHEWERVSANAISAIYGCPLCGAMEYRIPKWREERLVKRGRK